MPSAQPHASRLARPSMRAECWLTRITGGVLILGQPARPIQQRFVSKIGLSAERGGQASRPANAEDVQSTLRTQRRSQILAITGGFPGQSPLAGTGGEI
jgi:hypothetical protein